MVFNRLAESESKLGVLRWLEGVSVLELDTEAITHDRLLRDGRIDGSPVAGQLRPLLDRELSVFFYGLTKVHIAGAGHAEGDLHTHGLSKDTGGIARQFALGVVQSTECLPLAFEVFESNVAETKTLAPR